MKNYVRTFESFRKNQNEPINEELFGGVLNFFKNMWSKVSEEIKKMGENPSVQQIDDWMNKNPFNPSDDSYVFKGVIDEFKKKPEANDQDCLTLIDNILDPETGSLGKQGLQSLYDSLLKAFGKNTTPSNIVEYYFNTTRNRAIKDYKFAGGPDGGKVDPKNKNIDLKDTTHLPDFKKILISAGQDNKKKKELTINWVEKNLIPRLDKYLEEIKPEDVDAYLETKGIKSPTTGVDYKIGDMVIYKREKFNQALWDKLTDIEKKNPTEKAEEVQVGIKAITKIDGDNISFEGADGKTFVKIKSDILGIAEIKAEGQENLVNTLKDLKGKNPEAIKKIDNISKLYTDPKANKDKIAEIEKLIGGEQA